MHGWGEDIKAWLLQSNEGHVWGVIWSKPQRSLRNCIDAWLLPLLNPSFSLCWQISPEIFESPLSRVYKLWFLVTENPAFMNFLTNQAISLVSHVSVGWTDCPGRAGPTRLCYHTTKFSPSVIVLTICGRLSFMPPGQSAFLDCYPQSGNKGSFPHQPLWSQCLKHHLCSNHVAEWGWREEEVLTFDKVFSFTPSWKSKPFVKQTSKIFIILFSAFDLVLRKLILITLEFIFPLCWLWVRS